MARRIQLRRDTATNWTNTNPILAQGEVGIDLTNNKIKVGTGSTAWNSLGYFDDKETVLSNYAGHIIPSTDNTYDLGAPDKQWRDIFVSEGSIYIGDIKLSNDSGTLSVQRVTDAGLVTEEPIPGAPGVVTTDRLTNGENEIVLESNGTVTLPQGSQIVELGEGMVELTAGAGNDSYASLASFNSHSYIWVDNTAAYIGTDYSGNAKTWTFNAQGDIVLPNKWPIQFSPVFDAAHYNGGGEFQGDGTVSFNVELQGQGATFQWQADDPTFNTTRGYVGQQTFRYTEADHGITGYNLDILMEMMGSGPYSLQVEFSPPPTVADLAKIRSTDELFIKVGTKGWIFDLSGDIYLPASGDIRNSEGVSVLGGGADLGNIKIENNYIGTTDNPDTGQWGGYNLYLDPGGESNAFISIPSVSVQAEGGPLVIYNKGDATSIVQVFGRGGVQVVTNTDAGEKVFDFRDDGALQLPAGGDILDSTGTSVLGGGIAGLTSNTSFTPEEEGDEKYYLDINGDARLITYLEGEGQGDFGPGLGLGLGISDRHRSGVVAIGNDDVGYNSKPLGVYIGYQAGWNDEEEPQGESAIAIGAYAARNFAVDNSITLNATGEHLDPDESGLFIKPIREEQYDDQILFYNPNSGEVTYAANNFGTPELTDDKEVKITVGNSNYFAIVNRTNADGERGIDATAVAYDNVGDIITLHVSEVNIDGDNIDRLIITKIDNTENVGTTMWQKQIDQDVDVDTVHDVAIDSDDNIVIALSADNGSADDTIVLIKMDQNGTVLWKKDYHGIEPVFTRDGDLSIQNNTPQVGTYDGNPAEYIVVQGDYSRFPAGSLLEVNTGSNDYTSLGPVLAIAYDANSDTSALYFTQGTLPGQLNDNPPQYYTVSGNIPNSHLEVGAVAINGSNIFVAGYYNDDNSNGDDSGYVMKVALADGTLTWAKSFDVSPGFTKMFGMDVGADGNLVMVGTGETPGPHGAVVVKLSGTDGSEIWTSLFFDDENLSVAYDAGDVVVDSQNNVYVSVNTSQDIVHEVGNNTNVTIAYVTKINSSGSRQWTRRIGPGPCVSVATGIDCDDSGNVYLSALTTAQKNPNRDINDYFNSHNVLALAKYDSAGAVLWQRYVDCDSYWFYASADEEGGPPGQNDPTLNRGRNLSIGPNGKMAVQVTVVKKDADDNIWDSNYTESITVQIDQDGREMTVGSGSEKFTVKASRIPGKMITPQYTLVDIEESPLPISDVTADIAVTTAGQTFSDGELAQQVSKSAPYEYVFGNDGTLTIPNDGDLKLVQTQIGWFSIYGPIKNDYDNVDIRASVVDPSDGSVYAVGESDDYSQGFLTRYNSQGQIQWSIRFQDNNDGENNRANAVKIHPITGNVVVLLEYYGSYTYTLIVEVDPDTVKVVNSFGLRDNNDSADTTSYDFAITTLGDLVLVGRKYDEYRQQPVTKLAGSTLDILVFNASDIAGDAVTNAFFVSGTGIEGRYNVTQVNRHTGLTGTTSGAGINCEFLIYKNSSSETNYAGAGYEILTPGTGYQVNDTITISGTLLYGTTPANDLTATVTGIDPSGGVSAISLAGTAQNSKVNVYLNGLGFDFSESGNWTIDNNLGGEAFVWMSGFQKTLSAGSQNDDERYLSVALDIDNNIYAVGEMTARNGAASDQSLDSYVCAVVTKINNDGTHAWTRALNDTIDDCYAKSVSVTIPGSTVVVTHENSSQNSTVITKLDTSGNIKWQRRTNSNDDSSVVIDPSNGDIYAVVEANFENKFDDVAKVIRFNSVGEIVWRKFIGHLTYNNNAASLRFKNGRNLTLDADNLYISGYTYAQEDYYRNGVVIKIPKTGDTDGYYGNWALQQETYDVDKVNVTKFSEFTPVIGTGGFGLWNPDFSTQWWDPSDDDYYHTLWEIFDRDGGAIEFADGTRQTRSAQQIPQKRIDNGMNHRLTLEDMGGHIYITQNYNDTTVHVPYHLDNPLPIGYTVVIVNNSGSSINIDADGGGIPIIVPGIGSGQYWDLENQGMATLLKVDNDTWFMTGNVSDDN